MVPIKFTASIPIPQELVNMIMTAEVAKSEYTPPEKEANAEKKSDSETVHIPQILDLTLRIPFDESYDDRFYVPIGKFYMFKDDENDTYRVAEASILIEKWLVNHFPEPVIQATFELNSSPLPLIHIELINSSEKSETFNCNINFNSYFGAFVPYEEKIFNEQAPYHQLMLETSSSYSETFKNPSPETHNVESDIDDVIPSSLPDWEFPEYNFDQASKRTFSETEKEEDSEEDQEGFSPKRLRFDSDSESMFPSDDSNPPPSLIDERDGDNILIVDETDLSEPDSDGDQRRC